MARGLTIFDVERVFGRALERRIDAGIVARFRVRLFRALAARWFRRRLGA